MQNIFYIFLFVCIACIFKQIHAMNNCTVGEYCDPYTTKPVDVDNYARGLCYIDSNTQKLHCWGIAFDEWFSETGQMYHVPLPPGRHAIDVKVGSFGDPDLGPTTTHMHAS